MSKEFATGKSVYAIKLASIQARLNYLRGEIEAERISYSEILELQSLKEYIPLDDMLLRQWAGVEEEE